MLYREDEQGRIAITQPAHAWVSGQMARAWGNEQFGEVRPWEEVCLGAEQHDVGHVVWEQAPLLNTQTGLPYSFLELPRQIHIQQWSSAARLVLPQNRYAALLVSLHGTGLYERYDETKDTPENARIVQEYLAHERAFQDELFATLRADPHYSPFATEQAITRNRRLVQLWDALSLAICFARGRAQTFERVPTATDPITLTLTPRDNDPSHLIIDPWPFHQEHVELVYEGRRITQTFTDEATMREAFAHAPWITLHTILYPAYAPR